METYEEIKNVFLQKADKEELKRCFLYPENCVNYDYNFFGFLEQYYHLSKIIPKHWTIIDFGCASAFQSVFFDKHKLYFGVDSNTPIEHRYKTENSVNYDCSIEYAINNNYFKDLNLNETFVISNFVPSQCANSQIRSAFPNLFIYYPSGTEGEKL